MFNARMYCNDSEVQKTNIDLHITVLLKILLDI